MSQVHPCHQHHFMPGSGHRQTVRACLCAFHMQPIPAGCISLGRCMHHIRRVQWPTQGCPRCAPGAASPGCSRRAGAPGPGARARRQMLYDQPQLARAHTDAFSLTGERRHAAAARGVLDYLLRDLAAPGGGFFSAEVCHPTRPYIACRFGRPQRAAAWFRPTRPDRFSAKAHAILLAEALDPADKTCSAPQRARPGLPRSSTRAMGRASALPAPCAGTPVQARVPGARGRTRTAWARTAGRPRARSTCGAPTRWPPRWAAARRPRCSPRATACGRRATVTARRAGAPPPRRALCTGAPVAAMLPSVAWHLMTKPLHAAAAPGGHAPRSPLLRQRRLAQTVAPRACPRSYPHCDAAR